MSKQSESRGRYLAKNTAIFAIGNVAARLISFFLVPLYTNILTTAEYGVVDLVNTLCTVLAPILILNINEAVMRFALDKGSDYKKIMSTGLTIFVGAVFLGILVIPASSLFSEVAPYSTYIYFYTVTLAGSQLFLCYLRGKEKIALYSVGSVLQTMTIALFNILFLAVLHKGIKGYFLAYILSNVITILFAFIAGNVRKVIRNYKFDIKLTKAMATYSVVLIPNTFMWWIMNSSDRVMVTSIIGVAANGIYAVSYKLPSLVSTLTGIFNQAWSYSAIREDGAEDENEYNNMVFNRLISIVMLLSIALLTIVKPFLRLYVGMDYYSAWKYTPFLIIGSAYLTLATFMATSYTVHKDSFGYLFSATFGAALNIALNFVLIPIIHVYGAALATCISYIAVFTFRLIHTKKYIKYNINNKEFIGGSVILVLSSVILFLDNYFGAIIQSIILLLAVWLYAKTWIPIVRQIAKKIIRRKDNA